MTGLPDRTRAGLTGPAPAEPGPTGRAAPPGFPARRPAGWGARARRPVAWTALGLALAWPVSALVNWSAGGFWWWGGAVPLLVFCAGPLLVKVMRPAQGTMSQICSATANSSACCAP